MGRWGVVIGIVAAGWLGNAHAKTVEPGAMHLSAGLGPGVKLESSLPASAAYLMFNAGFEYAFTGIFSAVTDLAVGASDTVPLLVRTGVRARITGLRSPFSPYAQLQWVVGQTYDVDDRHPFTTGARVGLGVDYFLSANVAVAAIWTLNLLYVAGDAPGFLGTVEWIFAGTYRFDGL